MIKILQKLLGRHTQRTVSMGFHSNSLVRFGGNHRLTDNVIVRVQAGQAAILVGKEVPEKMLTHGEHPLNQQYLETNSVDVLFFNLIHPIKRIWKSQYQPADRELKRPFEGTYSAQIGNAMKFCNALIVKSNCGFPAPVQDRIAPLITDEFIDQWITVTVDDLLRKERVSADDIETIGDKLQEFLNKALRKEFEGYGLKVQEFVIGREVDKKPSEPEIEVVPVVKKISPLKNIQAAESAIVIASEPELVSVQPTEAEVPPAPSPLEMEEKIFYRVRSGEQIGPFSPAEIQELIAKGDLPPRELLWKKGMTAWKTAESFGMFSWD